MSVRFDGGMRLRLIEPFYSFFFTNLSFSPLIQLVIIMSCQYWHNHLYPLRIHILQPVRSPLVFHLSIIIALTSQRYKKVLCLLSFTGVWSRVRGYLACGDFVADKSQRNSSTLRLKKVPTFKLSVTLSNLNRFSKFLHCWKADEICYTTHTTLPTSP